ncbi:MAG: DegT/DnrJ/EryC1/StrS family aminotransferase [Pseudomonadota bacterium]
MIHQSNPGASYLTHKKSIDEAISRVLNSGWYILGQEVSEFEREFASAMNSSWAVGVASGTDAIELALRALGVQSGDRVITVSHTAVATVAAIARIGALPVFVDIDPARYTMSPESLEEVLTTTEGGIAKALVVVHLYGQPADMPKLLQIAKDHGLAVIEDCAQAHGASLDNKLVGNWGDLGCFSFYPTKNLGSLGDGGAIIGQKTDLKDHLLRLRSYGWKDRYISEEFGVNSRLDEIQAAVLRAKLPHLQEANAQRNKIAEHYDQSLSDLKIDLPQRSAGSYHVFHQYVIRLKSREQLISRMKSLGIGHAIHYPKAAHQQKAFSNPIHRPTPLQNTESMVMDALSLPMYPELTIEEIKKVVDTIKQAVLLSKSTQQLV